MYVLLTKSLAGRPRHRDQEKAEVEVREGGLHTAYIAHLPP